MEQNRLKEETLKLVKTAVSAIEEKKGEDVRVLDISKISYASLSSVLD